jgi:hypothetical protein
VETYSWLFAHPVDGCSQLKRQTAKYIAWALEILANNAIMVLPKGAFWYL